MARTRKWTEDQIRVLFEADGFTFRGVEGRTDSRGGVVQFAVGTCSEGHTVEMTVGNVRKGWKAVCRNCMREVEAHDSRAAFAAVGFSFDQLEGRKDLRGKLYQYAVGSCPAGHVVETRVDSVRQRGVACKACFLAGRQGIIYMAADSSHVYIGQTVNLSRRMRNHTSLRNDWSGSLFAKLPRSLTARITGAVALSDELGDDEAAVVKRALRACRTSSQTPSKVFFTILETGLLPDALDDAEKRWIKHLAKQGIPLVNRIHNPQYKAGVYDWDDCDVHAGYAASFLIAGHNVPSPATVG